MNILLTGVSSFTGTWFALSLAQNGHTVIGTLQADVDSYEGIRALRIKLLQSAGISLITNCSFGSPCFVGLVTKDIDMLCLHGAVVGNYRSVDFDVLHAVNSNTNNVRTVLETARYSGIKGVTFTGSVFEQDEGTGTRPLRSFSPYGLSKGLTWQVFRYWADTLDVPLHKFVIPNPFGPYEEPRFGSYLIKQWANEKTAHVKTPSYVRDNIHVSLLAIAYVSFLEMASKTRQWQRHNPSGYVGMQGEFAHRFAKEMGARLGFKTPLVLDKQTDFAEPAVRINMDSLKVLDWNETKAWDDLATFYKDMHGL